jgi:hypothetical protein
LIILDYTIFYKTEMPIESDWSDENWDLFISAYSPTERVRVTFDKANAEKKHWLIFPEYDYKKSEYPDGNLFYSETINEAEYIAEYWEFVKSVMEISGIRICIDITGFIRPYLIFLIKWLKETGINKFDVIYSEPIQYSKREETLFSDEIVTEVRQVAGFEGAHITDTSNDVLIIGVGYEDHLISHAAENKANARKIQIFGFPSLRADMYQENVLKAQKAEEAVGGETKNYFAPANDPFVTANVLKGIVDDLVSHDCLTNLYLCPVATKPQLLGFALYYLTECQEIPASIILPFSSSYSKDTSSGILRIWKYTIEIP